jgi:hypothetical protein
VSGDPFRDDHDAALARVDALEAENRELREELERASAPPQVVEPRRHDSNISRAQAWALVLIVTALIVGSIVPQCGLVRRTTSAASSGRAAAIQWERSFESGWTQRTAERSLPGCIDVAQMVDRNVDWTDRVAAGIPQKSGWETYCEPVVAQARAVEGRLSTESLAKLDAWTRSEQDLAAVRRRVWQAGALPPELVTELAAALAARTQALAALPAVRDEWLRGPDPDPK